MTDSAANSSSPTRLVLGTTILAALVALIAGSAAAWRWERRVDLVPGLPAPAGSRQLESEYGVGRRADVCRFLLLVPADVDAAMDSYQSTLVASGWVPEAVAAEAPRRYSRRRQTLTLSANARSQEPGQTRMRLQLRPCDPDGRGARQESSDTTVARR